MFTYFMNMPVWVWVGFVVVGFPWSLLIQAVTEHKRASQYFVLHLFVSIIWPIMVAFLAIGVAGVARNWSPSEFSTVLYPLCLLNCVLLGFYTNALYQGDSKPERRLITLVVSFMYCVGSISLTTELRQRHHSESLRSLAGYVESKQGVKAVMVLPSRFDPVFGSMNEIVGWKIVQTTHPELDLCLASGKLGFDLHSAYVGEKNQMVRIKFDEAQTSRIVVSDATVEPITWR